MNVSSMRPKWVISLAICLFAAGQVAVAAPDGGCTFPRGLDNEIAKKLPGAHLVSLADLNDYDKKLYKKDHGSRCPGLVKVDFYGDGKPTWALVLIAGENPKRKAELVVARRVDSDWEIRSLETANGTPVVWREGPGKYEDIYGKKTIQATRPVVVLCYYESSTIVFAWTGKDVDKVWLSD
jgi:hypothetical protein